MRDEFGISQIVWVQESSRLYRSGVAQIDRSISGRAL